MPAVGLVAGPPADDVRMRGPDLVVTTRAAIRLNRGGATDRADAPLPVRMRFNDRQGLSPQWRRLVAAPPGPARAHR